MPKPHTFVVQGTGPFPMDMLRYDGCWPYQQTDVEGMRYRPERMVVLMTAFNNSPTVARWESFGWKVVANHANR